MHRSGTIRPMTMHARGIAEAIQRAVGEFAAVVIEGGRAVGKSTLCRALIDANDWPGLIDLSEPGVIDINIYRDRDSVHLRLKNPYRKQPTSHSGNKMALANIRERLALHFDAEASIKTIVTDDSYEVRMVIPYLTEGGRA